MMKRTARNGIGGDGARARRRPRAAYAAVVTALLAGWGSPCWADTVSTAVGFVRQTVPEGRTVSVSGPFETAADVLVAGGVGAQLAGTGAAGDRLHVWLGKHFNSYTLSSGTWKLHETLTTAPETRLDHVPGPGYMLTRHSPGETTVLFHGEVAAETVVDIDVGPASWQLIGCPLPQDITLATLHDTGARSGDRVKLWDVAGQTWREYVKATGVWFGAGGEDTIIPAGTAFFFYNSGEAVRTLSFRIR